jgi:hypothetical protein
MFFVSEDLRQRAKKINEFQPTMSLVIHYNVDETNYGWNKPSPKNFNMAFVGGSFGEDEIDQPEDRIDVLRLLLSNEIEESESLSGCIVKNLVELTKVPPAAPWDAIYLRESCLSTPTTGVYCRNLALTRQIKGALCYGESLYQDNVKECNLLCKEDILVEGILTCNRVEEVAHAYYEGVLQYLRNRTK